MYKKKFTVSEANYELVQEVEEKKYHSTDIDSAGGTHRVTLPSRTKVSNAFRNRFTRQDCLQSAQ
jgi:head-tail adaptor